MALYKSLLFLHGHIADAGLARSLADAEGDAATPPSGKASAPARRPFARPRRANPGFFGSLWYLGGLDDIDPRIGEHGEAYAPKYARRAATARLGGKASPAAGACLAGCG